MSKEEALSSIEQHREKIDELDIQIVRLLNARAHESLAIRALKPDAQLGLYDPRREEDIFSKIDDANEGPMYDQDLRQIYATILKVMKELR